MLDFLRREFIGGLSVILGLIALAEGNFKVSWLVGVLLVFGALWTLLVIEQGIVQWKPAWLADRFQALAAYSPIVWRGLPGQRRSGSLKKSLGAQPTEPVSPAPVRPDKEQLLRTIDRTSAKLRHQLTIAGEWRLLKDPTIFDPDDRGEWESEDRKGLLQQDPRLRPAFAATEDAFSAISILRDATNLHRLDAIEKIKKALTELEEAAGVVQGVAVEDAPSGPLNLSLRYLLDRHLIVSVNNGGPTILDAHLHVLAPRRLERAYLNRVSESGLTLVSDGVTDEIELELVAGFPKSLRWRESPLELQGHAKTDWKFFLPRFEGDPIRIRIGSDALAGWYERDFVTPSDEVMVLRERNDDSLAL